MRDWLSDVLLKRPSGASKSLNYSQRSNITGQTDASCFRNCRSVPVHQEYPADIHLCVPRPLKSQFFSADGRIISISDLACIRLRTDARHAYNQLMVAINRFLGILWSVRMVASKCYVLRERFTAGSERQLRSICGASSFSFFLPISIPLMMRLLIVIVELAGTYSSRSVRSDGFRHDACLLANIYAFWIHQTAHHCVGLPCRRDGVADPASPFHRLPLLASQAWVLIMESAREIVSW